MIATLETEKLILRPLHESDALAIYEYASSETVTRWTAWEMHRSIDDTIDFIRDIAFSQYRQGHLGPYGIVLKQADDDTVIGTIGCFWSAREHAQMELGYVLAQPFWGQGITTHACKAILDHAFQTTHVNRIESCCSPENTGSRRVLEKLGFALEGTMREKFYHQSRQQFWDAQLFSLLRKDFAR